MVSITIGYDIVVIIIIFSFNIMKCFEIIIILLVRKHDRHNANKDASLRKRWLHFLQCHKCEGGLQAGWSEFVFFEFIQWK